MKSIQSTSPLLFVMTLCLLLATAPAWAETVTITGTGNPVTDVQAVQEAVDKGGTVHLKGRFNFGADGRIKITKNVTIQGDTEYGGIPVTTIVGGFWTFYGPLPVPGAQPSTRGPIVTIRSLHFDKAKGTPLHFPHTGGLHVQGCTVTNVSPQQINVAWQDSDTLAFQAGIVVGNRLDFRGESLKGAARGTIRVEDCRFYMDTARPDETAGRGIMIDWTWGSEIVITDNIVQGASRNGIEVLDNTLDDKGEGSILISGNRILTPEEGIEYPNSFGPNGIVAGWFFDTKGGADFTRNNRMAINRNRIECRGESSTGLLLYANDVAATCNDIILAGGSQARGIVQTGSRGAFLNNRVRGEGRYAIFCYPFEALTATANLFAWTDLTEFTAIKSQALLGGAVNKVVGAMPFVNDKGKGNHVMESRACTLPTLDLDGEDWEPVDE